MDDRQKGSYKTVKFLSLAFIFILGTGLAISATTPDVSIGQNGIQINSGTLDMGGGDITDGGTTIWDASKGYIPEAQMQTANLVWSDLGIAKTDVSKSDVGLGNVENTAAVNESGDTMTGDLKMDSRLIIKNSKDVAFYQSSSSSSNIGGIDAGDGLDYSFGSSNTNNDMVISSDGSNGDDLVFKTSSSNACAMDDDGDFECQGSKNWVHNLNSTHQAVYTSQESPQVRAVYEGKAHVVDRKKVELPSHFTKTVSNTEPMLRAQVTPQGTLTNAAVMEKTDDYIEIKVGKETDVNFRITGIREGYEDKQVVRKK